MSQLMPQRRPFIQTLHAAIDKVTPLALADHSWDNVGLLLESCPSPREDSSTRKVLCTIDLTTAVCEEAIEAKASAIVAYHPPIFRPLKSFTSANPIERSLLSLAAHGTSVWSIHTAADNCRGGTNDYIATMLQRHLNTRAESVRPVSPFESGGQEGSGRIVELSGDGLTLEQVVEAVKKTIDRPFVQLARATSSTTSDVKRSVRTIAICVGSGGSVLKGVEADVFLTGEMGHHEVLAATAQGTNVILCHHSAIERPWLSQYVQDLKSTLAQLDPEHEWDVAQSKRDREPLEIV